MLKMFRLGRSLVVILLIEQNLASFREYEQSVGARCTQTERFLHGLSADKLRCAVVCLATANCHSYNYYHGHDISTSLNCELLTLTWADTVNADDALTADDADWSFYGSHPLLTSGRHRRAHLSPLKGVEWGRRLCGWLQQQCFRHWTH